MPGTIEQAKPADPRLEAIPSSWLLTLWLGFTGECPACGVMMLAGDPRRPAHRCALTNAIDRTVERLRA